MAREYYAASRAASIKVTPEQIAKAKRIVVTEQKATTTLIRESMNVDLYSAMKLLSELEKQSVVSATSGKRGSRRKVLVTLGSLESGEVATSSGVTSGARRFAASYKIKKLKTFRAILGSDAGEFGALIDDVILDLETLEPLKKLSKIISSLDK